MFKGNYCHTLLLMYEGSLHWLRHVHVKPAFGCAANFGAGAAFRSHGDEGYDGRTDGAFEGGAGGLSNQIIAWSRFVDGWVGGELDPTSAFAIRSLEMFRVVCSLTIFCIFVQPHFVRLKKIQNQLTFHEYWISTENTFNLQVMSNKIYSRDFLAHYLMMIHSSW
jgi:hypothetical protein